MQAFYFFQIKFERGVLFLRSIIIARTSAKLISSLEVLFRQIKVPIAAICKSGSEIRALESSFDDVVLVCGPLKDMPAIYVSKILPVSWDMLLLVSSSQPFPYYVSNVTAVNMPINKRKFLQMIQDISNVKTQSFGNKTTAKSTRTQEDKSVIDLAKKKIMSQRGMSEGDAHKYLQRYSMNIGVSLSEIANRILEE